MQYTFQVQGMTCGHCERAVVHAVRQVDTDALVKVDLATGQVIVESDKSREALANAIQEEGYKVAARAPRRGAPPTACPATARGPRPRWTGPWP